MFHRWPDRLLKGYSKPVDLHEMLWQRGQKPQEPGQRWIPGWMRKYADTYIERKEPMREIFKWLDGEMPMLIVHGPGGMGKTRLCVQAILRIVGRFEGRVYGVALDKEFGATPEAVTPEALAGAIARAVKAPEEVQQKPLKSLAPYLEGQGEILLFLDNAESVFKTETEKWLGKIVPGYGGRRWIVSSRHDSRFAGNRLPVCAGAIGNAAKRSELAKNACYKLFKARMEESAEAGRHFRSEMVARITADGGISAGDGMVASQRQFAPWAKSQTDKSKSAGMAAMLGAAGQRRGDEDRHENMEACIHWSVQMLPDKNKKPTRPCTYGRMISMLAARRRLGTFPLSIWRAGRTQSLLERLELNGATRYRLLPVFREYAQRRAEALQIDVDTLRREVRELLCAARRNQP